jgi:hypothetical protein
MVRRASVLLLLLIATAPAGVVATTGQAAAAGQSPTRTTARSHTTTTAKVARTRDTLANAGSGVLSRVRAGLTTAERVARRLVLLVSLALIACLLTRIPARRRRRVVRLTLVPFRSQQAGPEDLRRMLESWHQQVLARWWQRVLFGQPSLALEVRYERDASGGHQIGRVSIVCPESRIRAIEGGVLACYPDGRLLREPVTVGEPFGHVLRLKKRYGFIRALREGEGEERPLVDAVLIQMASMGESAVLQYSLVPTPALFDRYSRRRFRSQERSWEGRRARNDRDPGLRSEVLSAELEGGLRLQNRPVFFCDIRIAAQSREGCEAIAGIIRGETGAENRLVIRQMRGWGRAGLYERRVATAAGNPIPGWRRGVLSSTELAALWQAPSPGLKEVRVRRTPLPRIPAPPEITRAPASAIARDEHGLVGIRAVDKTDGLALIGGQKTGKTSLLCRTVQADALDEDCAMVVLMPKPGDALKALSMVPPNRTVHYLDLEHPEFGINPLMAVGDASMIADKVVDAFRDVNMEGDIRGSSDRYLRQAAQAAIGGSRCGAIEGPPTLWHMYRMLMPSETAFRDHVVAGILSDSRFVDTATFFGRELPTDLRESRMQTVAKLDAPRNKLLRLMVESLDKVLRHPHQLSLDDVVRNKEVLVVDGKMGTFGADNCRVMMQFILNTLYGALQRQQQRPEAERVRVALKVDEAHLIINESFADALATLRSAGLEVVAAWQYGEQIQEPKIRSGLLSLLRQRCMFSMGEAQDAREMSTIAMAVYADVIHADAQSQANLRVSPDTIFNLPNHHAVCSWISEGARVPAFIARTMKLETDEEVVRHHREAQLARGCFVPDRLPDPLPDIEPIELGMGAASARTPMVPETAADPPAPAGSGEPGAAVPARAPAGLAWDPTDTSVDRSEDVAAPAPVVGAPESFTELDLDDVRGIIWDKPATPLPVDKRTEPTQRELEILAALWSYRFLFATQLRRRWWPDAGERAAQQILNKMTRAGWVRRFKFQIGQRGAQQRVYCLTRLGFDLAQATMGPRGPYVPADAVWREPQINDPRRVLRDLHTNGWVLALRERSGRSFVRWRGPGESRVLPPRRRERGEWLDLKPSEITVGARQLRDFEGQKFEPVSPDATVELRIAMGERPLRLDLMIEMERSRGSAAAADKLRRYDGLLAGWAPLLDRYQTLGTPPLIVFVSEDARARDALIRIADKVVVARLAKAGVEETEWPCPGRKAMYFVLERDLHAGSLEALQLPEQPPELRVRLGGPKQRAVRPWRVHIIEPRLLRPR